MNIDNFLISSGWCTRFMKRNKLVLRQKMKISQRLPDDLEEKITSFQSFVIRARWSKNYSLVNIGNMDETPVWFDMPPSKTVDSVGAKTVLLKTTGHEKTRFTVVLACLADGTKLKPMVIFKRKTMPKDNFPAGVVVHNHPKGWMDESGVKIWIAKVWWIPDHLFILFNWWKLKNQTFSKKVVFLASKIGFDLYTRSTCTRVYTVTTLTTTYLPTGRFHHCFPPGFWLPSYLLTEDRCGHFACKWPNSPQV